MTLAGDVESVVAIAICGGVFIVWIIASQISGMAKRAAFEKSRREIAAYVAEGSMSPEDGERLLKAESKSMESK